MRTPEDIDNEIARVMRDPNALRGERGRMPSFGRRDHYDPNQPRVPAGHPDGGQWTEDGRPNSADELPKVRLAFLGPLRRPAQEGIRRGIETLFALFATLSARNTPEQRAIFEFNARQYLVDPSGALSRADVETLNREQVKNVCGRLEDVQSDTDKADRSVRGSSGWMSPQQFGTAVHEELKNLIRGRKEPNLRAEVSRVKGQEADADYGTRASVRIDVLEYAGEGTVCVYDIKTGSSRRSGLSPARMRELAENALKAYPETQRIIVTEIRASP